MFLVRTAMYIQICLFPAVIGSASTSSLSTSGSHQGVVIEHSELFIQPGKIRHMTYYCEECPVVLPERHVWHLVVLVLVTEQHWFEDRGWGGRSHSGRLAEPRHRLILHEVPPTVVWGQDGCHMFQAINGYIFITQIWFAIIDEWAGLGGVLDNLSTD